MPKPNELLLIDLSSIFYPIWSSSATELDLNVVALRTVEQVHLLAKGHPLAVVCCDSGRTFRNDLDPEYKANRAAKPEALMTQLRATEETLTRAGFVLFSAKGFEADDIIASATARARQDPDIDSILIASADKDMLALVGRYPNGTVTVLNTRDGSVIDENGVISRLGVRPDQVVDYLTLVGDPADNIKGAVGVGPKGAAVLLTKWGSLDAFYAEFREKGGTAMSLSLKQIAVMKAFAPLMEKTRALVQTRTDVPLAWDDLLAPRQQRAAAATRDESWTEGGAEYASEAEAEAASDADPGLPVCRWCGQEHPGGPENCAKAEGSNRDPQPTPAPTPQPIAEEQAVPPLVEVIQPKVAAMPAASLPRAPQALVKAPGLEMSIQPRNYREVRIAAGDLFNSQLFLKDYGTKEAVLSTIILGRELGIPAMGSLRGIFIVEGRHTLSAQLMVALILRSGLAEYFEPVEISDKIATFETKRRGDRQPFRITHTIEMAQRAGLVKAGSNWVKTPEDMLVARSSARLGRLKYPDVLFGLYLPEEILEVVEAERERAVS